MKLTSYASTPYLDRYPEQDRLSVYRTTHQRLMGEDADYCRKCRAYVIGIACLALFSAGVAVGGTSDSGALGIVLSILAIVAGIVSIIFLAFRQQALMNRAVGSALKREADQG